MNHRHLVAALGVAALTGIPSSAAEPPLVANPCALDAPLPAGTSCLQATLTSPEPGSDTDIVGGPATTFEVSAVGEFGQPLFFYLLREDGTLVNDIPHVVAADDTGRVNASLTYGSLGNGAYRLVAYYLASTKDRPREDTFFQFTGTPTVTYTVDRPPVTGCQFNCFPPPPPEPKECRMLDIRMIGDIQVGRRSDGGATFFTMVRPGEAPATASARASLIRMGLNHALYETCEVAKDLNLDPTTLSGPELLMTVAKGLSKIGLYVGPLLDTTHGGPAPDSYWFLTPSEVETATRNSMQSGECTGVSPSSSLVDFAGSVYKVNYVFYDRTLTSNGNPGHEECDGWVIDYISGQSPLLFLSSDTEARATLSVRPRNGRVSYAEPAPSPEGWTLDVSPDASTAPVYYEFDGTEIPRAARGWTVRGDETVAFLRSTLGSWGFAAEEIEAFLAKDVTPNLPEAPYLEIGVLADAEVDAFLPLAIEPAPARVERRFFTIRAVDAPTAITPPAALPHAASEGLAVRELGAAVITR